MTSTLCKQVKRRLRDDDTYAKARQRVQRNDAFDDVVDAAIGVVLAVVADEIKALRPAAGHDKVDPDGTCVSCIEKHALDDALAVVERLRG